MTKKIDPTLAAQQLALKRDAEAERARIAQEAAEEALARRPLPPARATYVGADGASRSFELPPGTKLETPPRPQTPDGTMPLHETPDASGLRVDPSLKNYTLARVTPSYPRRWPEVHEFDERVAELEERQAGVTAELVALQEQLPAAKMEDREGMARWVSDPTTERPLPTAPRIEDEVAKLTAEQDGLARAIEHVLDAKCEFVERHRGRLAREAVRARRLAVERLQDAITAVEQARREATDCCLAERWARTFPGEEASANDLRVQFVKGGRITKAIPRLTDVTVATQLTEALHEDATWLGTVLDDEQRAKEVDPHFEAIWEGTEEGREAIGLANRRVREGLKPRNVHAAGWEGD